MNDVGVPSLDRIAMAVGEGLLRAAERTGKDLGPLESQEWLDSFSDCEPIELQRAFANFSLHSPFSPSISSIRQEIERARFGGVSGGWILVQSAARACATHSAWFMFVFEHPAIHFSVESLGGWTRVMRELRSSEKAGYVRRDFFKAWEDYRPSVPYPAGIGEFDGSNAVVIGHHARALAVYRNGVKLGSAFAPGTEALRDTPWSLPSNRAEGWPDELRTHHLAPAPRPPVRASAAWFDEFSTEGSKLFGPDADSTT